MLTRLGNDGSSLSYHVVSWNTLRLPLFTGRAAGLHIAPHSNLAKDVLMTKDAIVSDETAK